MTLFPRPFWADIARNTVLGVIVVVISVLGINQLNNFGNQTKASNRIIQNQQKTLSALARNSKIRTQQIHELQTHIDCIVELFTQPNRANLTITDINDCKIAANSSLNTTGVSTTTPTTQKPLAVKKAQKRPPATTTTPPPQNTQSPPIFRSIVCKLTFGLIKC